MSSWPLCHESGTDRWLAGLLVSTKSYRISQKIIVSFFVDVIVGMADFSQCEEYGIKHGKMQLHKIMNTTSLVV